IDIEAAEFLTTLSIVAAIPGEKSDIRIKLDSLIVNESKTLNFVTHNPLPFNYYLQGGSKPDIHLWLPWSAPHQLIDGVDRVEIVETIHFSVPDIEEINRITVTFTVSGLDGSVSVPPNTKVVPVMLTAKANIDWLTFNGETIYIASDGEYKMTINTRGVSQLTSLTLILSNSPGYSEQMGVRFDSVIVNGSVELGVTTDKVLYGNPQLWDGWSASSQLLKNVTRVNTGTNVDFSVPNVSNINTIEVTFTVTGLGDTGIKISPDSTAESTTAATTTTTSDTVTSSTTETTEENDSTTTTTAQVTETSTTATEQITDTSATTAQTGTTDTSTTTTQTGTTDTSTTTTQTGTTDTSTTTTQTGTTDTSTTTTQTGTTDTITTTKTTDVGITSTSSSIVTSETLTSSAAVATKSTTTTTSGVTAVSSESTTTKTTAETKTFPTTKTTDVSDSTVSTSEPTTTASATTTAPATTPNPDEFYLGKPGHVLGNAVITISDALEVLRHLAKLPSVIEGSPDSRQAACIVSKSAPTINDALEILKKLAKLPNKIDGTA
ncbi:MAG: hypothetical protein FWF82_01605, partial [Oscillospiraceae bacterium]|nr:hypothetical protein [Oscillospiraceae bacterium]